MEKKGLHALNTADKINLASLSVQRIRMNVEVKQTKLLSYSTQEASIKSQINSAQKIALIVCPVYDEDHLVWKRVMSLMSQQEELGKKMSALTDDDDFGMDEHGNTDNVRDIIDLSDNASSH